MQRYIITYPYLFQRAEQILKRTQLMERWANWEVPENLHRIYLYAVCWCVWDLTMSFFFRLAILSTWWNWTLWLGAVIMTLLRLISYTVFFVEQGSCHLLILSSCAVSCVSLDNSRLQVQNVEFGWSFYVSRSFKGWHAPICCSCLFQLSIDHRWYFLCSQLEH